MEKYLQNNTIYIFIILLLVILWMMDNKKIGTIRDLCVSILKVLPLAAIFISLFKYLGKKNKDEINDRKKAGL